MNELHWVSPCAHWRLIGSQRPSLGGNGERVGLGTAGESSQSPPWPGDSGSSHSAFSFGCLVGEEWNSQLAAVSASFAV